MIKVETVTYETEWEGYHRVLEAIRVRLGVVELLRQVGEVKKADAILRDIKVGLESINNFMLESMCDNGSAIWEHEMKEVGQ